MGLVSKMEDDFERSEQDLLKVRNNASPEWFQPRGALIQATSCALSLPPPHEEVPDVRYLPVGLRLFIARTLARAENLELVDKTAMPGGCLWIVGGHEALKHLLEPLGMTYTANGGKQSQHRPAWYLKGS